MLELLILKVKWLFSNYKKIELYLFTNTEIVKYAT
jgi:hypothetical protein